ncbi:MAG TPA: aminotransferase class V-fold PLP-dependent enzyme, partial [Pirellulaceae bacterium]
NPVPRIVEAARSVGALVLIDAAQAVPHEVVDVQAWGADFVAFSGHKMLGPSGVGVLYGREAVLDAMPPFLGGGSMIRRVRMDGFEPADLPAKFEAGTPPIVSAIGLRAAIDYLEGIGLEAIARHARTLTEAAHARLAEFPDVRILGPPCDRKHGIVSFTMGSVHSHDIAQLVDREGIAIRAGHHCAMPLHKRLGIQSSSRVSFYLYNTLEEVDLLIAALNNVRGLFRRKVRT